MTIEPPVDRKLKIESIALYRSIGQLTGAISGEQSSLAVDRVGRTAYLPGLRARLCTSVDRIGRPPESLCSLKKAPVDRPVYQQRVLLSVSSSGRPRGRPAREPLLSGSSLGRPGGRPVGSTVINLTVGRWTARPTGRAILPFACCQ